MTTVESVESIIIQKKRKYCTRCHRRFKIRYKILSLNTIAMVEVSFSHAVSQDPAIASSILIISIIQSTINSQDSLTKTFFCMELNSTQRVDKTCHLSLPTCRTQIPQRKNDILKVSHRLHMKRKIEFEGSTFNDSSRKSSMVSFSFH